MSILDNEGHDPNGLGNRPSWSEVNQLRARVAELEDPHFLKGLQARVDKAESRVNLLEVTEDMYRTVAMRHEARVAELVVLLREALDSRAPDYVDAVYSNWSKLARAAVLNAPANAGMLISSTSNEDAKINTPRPAQSPAGAEAMREAILQALPGGTHCDPQEIADMIRAIPVLAGAVTDEMVERAAQSPAGAKHCPYCLSTEVILDEGRNFCRDCLERFGCW